MYESSEVEFLIDDDEQSNYVDVELTRGKRKSREASGSYSSLEETIKRFKITNTPGELRLQKDIKEVVGLSGVNIEIVDASSVIITFNDDETLAGMTTVPSSVVPNNFLLSVPRYYPHAAPSIRCLDVLNRIRNSPHSPHGLILGDGSLTSSPRSSGLCFINAANGDVIHPRVTTEWTALCSLRDILDVLHFIRVSVFNS